MLYKKLDFVVLLHHFSELPAAERPEASRDFF